MLVRFVPPPRARSRIYAFPDLPLLCDLFAQLDSRALPDADVARRRRLLRDDHPHYRDAAHGRTH